MLSRPMVSDKIETLFQEYANASMNGNAALVAEYYAPDFMVGTREGASTFRNDEKFIEWLNGVFQFNRNAGLHKLQVRKVESQPLGEYFMRVTVTWVAVFAKKPTREFNFRIHYILNCSGENYKIVLYISEDDQEEQMKKEGLL